MKKVLDLPSAISKETTVRSSGNFWTNVRQNTYGWSYVKTW